MYREQIHSPNLDKVFLASLLSLHKMLRLSKSAIFLVQNHFVCFFQKHNSIGPNIFLNFPKSENQRKNQNNEELRVKLIKRIIYIYVYLLCSSYCEKSKKKNMIPDLKKLINKYFYGQIYIVYIICSLFSIALNILFFQGFTEHEPSLISNTHASAQIRSNCRKNSTFTNYSPKWGRHTPTGKIDFVMSQNQATYPRN